MFLKTKIFTALIVIATSTAIFFVSCGKKDNPLPFEPGYVNFSISPNSTEYLQLNSVGGWAYVTAYEPSRGIIIYRLLADEFKAYERTPMYLPDSCCNYSGNTALCTRLIVEDFTFAVDTCLGTRYLLIDGSIVDGPGSYPMFQYNTNYDGETLFVFN